MSNYRIQREAAVNELGIDAVKAVENSGVVPTGRVTDGTADAGLTEFAANAGNLTMYVFVDSDEAKTVESYDEIDWATAIEETSEYEITE